MDTKILDAVSTAIKNKSTLDKVDTNKAIIFSKGAIFGIYLPTSLGEACEKLINPHGILSEEERHELGKYCADYIKKCAEKREVEEKQKLITELSKTL